MMKKGQALRVLRGGAYNNSAVNCRSAYRNNNNPDNRNNNNGLRVVRAPDRQSSVAGASEVTAGESRPVPVTVVTSSKHQPERSGLVGEIPSARFFLLRGAEHQSEGPSQAESG